MELVPDDPDYKVPFLTGYFRDKKRRIDMVLVSKYTGKDELETMKMTFLMNAINMGLDIEIEAGNSKEYADLNFIKLHATERVLQHFGLYYNIKKAFKSSHLELIKCGIFEEKEMIKIVRRWYPTRMFSTFERSQIVYKMLTSVTFGHPENFVGIHHLIGNKIFLDMFPLHDGPVHLVLGQSPLQLNGRQALFYNWCGYENLFRQMPLHIIREYLGERIGFFFAFYQFYNFLMFLLGLLGIYIFSKNYDIKDRLSRRLLPKTDTHIYPKCRDFVACPFRHISQYNREVLLKEYLDNPYVYYMAFATVVWGFLLAVLWRRIEIYWYWMWEVNEDDARSLTRPEFRKVGRLWNWHVVYRRPIELAVLLAVVIVIVVLYPGLMLDVYLKMLNRMRYVEEYVRMLYNKDTRPKEIKIGIHAVERINHIVIVFLGILNAVFIMSTEKAWCFVAKILNYTYEPRSEWQYEKRYIFNTFSVVVLMNIVVVSFYAHVKGALFTHPKDEEHWLYPLQLGLLNCGMLYCLDEVFLIYVSTFKTKMFYQQVMRSLTCLPSDKQKDPSKFDPPKYDSAPCWEREIKLFPVKEDLILDLYLKQFIQIAVVTFFASVFPLAPFIASVWNWWNMGYLAKFLVVHSRRPLLLQTWGIGPWHDILLFMPFIACFTNAIYVVRNNSFIDWNLFKRYWGHQESGGTDIFFHKYFQSYMEEKDLVSMNLSYWKNFPPTIQGCHYPGQYVGIAVADKKYHIPKPGKWAISWRQTLFVFIFWLLSMTVYLLVKSQIAPISSQVREMRRAEEAVKQYGMKRIPKITQKKPEPKKTKKSKGKKENKDYRN